MEKGSCFAREGKKVDPMPRSFASATSTFNNYSTCPLSDTPLIKAQSYNGNVQFNSSDRKMFVKADYDCPDN